MSNNSIRIGLVGGLKNRRLSDVNKRYALVYYQRTPNDYQNYTIRTDGRFTITDLPLDRAAPVNPAISTFRHQFHEGMLVVEVTEATWVEITHHISAPKQGIHERSYYFSTPVSPAN